jgi:hypothetical protein
MKNLEELKATYEQLGKDIKALEQKKAFDYKNPLGLVEGDEYFSICYDGEINTSNFVEAYWLDAKLSILGNMFKTLGDAERRIEFLEAENLIASAVIKTGGSGIGEFYPCEVGLGFLISNQSSLPANLLFKSYEAFKEALSEIGEQPFRTYLKGW